MERAKRAADFLLDIDGAAVALEVTDFYPSQRAAARRGIGNWLAQRLEADLQPETEARALGSVSVSVTLSRTPDRRRLGTAINALTRSILDALPASGTALVKLDDQPFEDLVSLIRVFRWPDRPSRVAVVHQPHGSFVVPAVQSFLERAIPAKAAQTAEYERVIVAAFDRSFVGDPETFEILLGERAAQLPANWQAFYFVTPVSGAGAWRAQRVWHRREAR